MTEIPAHLIRTLRRHAEGLVLRLAARIVRTSPNHWDINVLHHQLQLWNDRQDAKRLLAEAEFHQNLVEAKDTITRTFDQALKVDIPKLLRKEDR